MLTLESKSRIANVAPAFSLSSPNEERAGVRRLREQGEIVVTPGNTVLINLL